VLAVAHTDQLGACVLRLCSGRGSRGQTPLKPFNPFRRVKLTTACRSRDESNRADPSKESARSNDLRTQLASAGSVISVSVGILKFWHRFERVFCRSSQYQFIVFMFELAYGDRHVVFADT